jgi:hypothetical protein
MPKLTAEMVRRIFEEYHKKPVYKIVAKKLGIREQTVSRVVKEDEAKKAAAGPQEAANEKRAATVSVGEGSGDNTSRTASARSPNKSAINQQQKPLTSKQLKIVYSELNAKKKPSDIIATYGFPPPLVDQAYIQFLKWRDCNLRNQQVRILRSMEGYHEEIGLDYDELERYQELFTSRGYLTDDDMDELVMGYFNALRMQRQ